MPSITIKIDGKPVPNNTQSGRGRYYKPAGVAEYTKLVQGLALKEKLATRWKMTEKPVSLKCDIFLEIPMGWSKKKKEMALRDEIMHKVRPDGSNIYYLVENALKNIIYKDDSQVKRGCHEKFYAINPYVKIEVTEL